MGAVVRLRKEDVTRPRLLRRKPNAELRTREHLTEQEVESRRRSRTGTAIATRP